MGARAPQEVNIDMTPMIDVVFQLIIFFIVTVQMDQESILREITLPRSVYAQEQKGREGNQITIQINKEGKFFIGNAPIPIGTIEKVLKSTVRQIGADNVLGGCIYKIPVVYVLCIF